MENTHPSLIRIVYTHALASLDEHGFRAAAKNVMLSFVAGLLSAGAMYPLEIRRAFLAAMQWHDGAIPRTAWIWIAVFLMPRAFAHMRKALKRIPRAPAGETIEGMNTEKVVAHLSSKRTFKRDDVEDEFEVPRYRYTALVKRLKKIGVLVPGDNNMSVLSEDWTADMLRELFAGRETAAELELPVKIHRISDRSPTPFKRRILEDCPMETDEKQLGNPCATVCAA